MHYHQIRDVIENSLMNINKISTDQNPSNMMMKIVPKEKHKLYKALVGMNAM